MPTPIETLLIAAYHFGRQTNNHRQPPTRTQAAQGFAALGADAVAVQRLLNYPSFQHAKHALQQNPKHYNPDRIPSSYVELPFSPDVLRRFDVYSTIDIIPDWAADRHTPIIETVLFLLNYWLTPYYLQELTNKLLQFRESRFADPNKHADIIPFFDALNQDPKKLIPTLSSMGFTQAQIAEMLNMTQPGVHYQLSKPPRKRKKNPERRPHRRVDYN